MQFFFLNLYPNFNCFAGPRFILQPIRIFKGSFCGETLWENPFYVTPAKVLLKKKKLISPIKINNINIYFRQDVY